MCAPLTLTRANTRPLSLSQRDNQHITHVQHILAITGRVYEEARHGNAVAVGSAQPRCPGKPCRGLVGMRKKQRQERVGRPRAPRAFSRPQRRPPRIAFQRARARSRLRESDSDISPLSLARARRGAAADAPPVATAGAGSAALAVAASAAQLRLPPGPAGPAALSASAAAAAALSCSCQRRKSSPEHPLIVRYRPSLHRSIIGRLSAVLPTPQALPSPARSSEPPRRGIRTQRPPEGGCPATTTRRLPPQTADLPGLSDGHLLLWSRNFPPEFVSVV